MTKSIKRLTLGIVFFAVIAAMMMLVAVADYSGNDTNVSWIIDVSEGVLTVSGSGTMPTMLPGCSFFLGIPYGNAKGYIEAGLPVALASDYNPGSSPSGNMRFVMALGCIRMRLTPEQSFNACTINTAYAKGVSDQLGSITVGKKANLIITKPVPSLAFIPYSHQTPVIDRIILGGVTI